MNKKTKIWLGIMIAGSSLTAIGMPMFIAAGVGVKTMEINDGTNIKEIRSGYFYYKDNFELLASSNGYDESKANEEDLSYDFYGFAKYMIDKINSNTLPQIPAPDYVTITSLDNIKSFYNNVIINKPLFITGAVLWPIGVLIILISLPFFISFKRKGE